MKYQSYKALYKQDFTIPIRFLDDYNLDFGKALVFFFLMVVNSLVLGILALGGKTFLFIPRPLLAFALSALQMLILMRVPTAGKPLIVWLLYVPYFLLFVPKVTRAFRPVKLKKRWKEDWRASFRPVISTGKKVYYTQIPLVGQVEQFDGLQLQTHGATRLKFYPFSKKVTVHVGDYEKLERQTRPLGRFRATKMEVGRGEVRVLRRDGKRVVQYTPLTEMGD